MHRVFSAVLRGPTCGHPVCWARARASRHGFPGPPDRRCDARSRVGYKALVAVTGGQKALVSQPSGSRGPPMAGRLASDRTGPRSGHGDGSNRGRAVAVTCLRPLSGPRSETILSQALTIQIANGRALCKPISRHWHHPKFL